MESGSAAAAAAAVASKDIRIRLRSVKRSSDSLDMRSKLPVLRFLGSDSGETSLSRPRSSSPVWFSAPDEKKEARQGQWVGCSHR